MSIAIETSKLSKHFGTTRALNNINLQIKSGSVFGLLGPNGAGKTTTVRLLATLLRPSSGEARVLGYNLSHDAAKIRTKVALTGQFASVDDELTGHENLVLMGRLLGLGWRDARRRAQQLLDAFSLSEAAHRQVTTYSGGMRRRIDIAASLITTPAILFLDEPTTGLDPRSRNQVWDIVRAVAAQGTTVLLTTQYLEEADQLADRLAVIDRGELIAQGTSRELKASVGSGSLTLFVGEQQQRDRARSLLQAHAPYDAIKASANNGLRLQVTNNDEALAALHLLQQNNIAVDEFAMAAPSLDEVFFALTGHTTDQAQNPEENAP